MTGHTRRRVLGLVSAAGGSLLARPRVVFGQTPPAHVPVAVVGGGMAGLFAAMRLRKEGRREVALFESSDRFGGRLLSVKIPGIDGLVAEIGGMRFTDMMISCGFGPRSILLTRPKNVWGSRSVMICSRPNSLVL